MEIELRNNHDIIKVQETLFQIAPMLKEKPYVCEIRPYIKKRSLDANAYFHVLCDKIAMETNRTLDEVKIELNIRHGTYEVDDNGDAVWFMIRADVPVEKFHKYPYFYKSSTMNGVKYNYYMFRKHTHDLNSREMAKLIDGTIEAAKELGIETKTPFELAEMSGYEKIADNENKKV